MLTKKIMTRVYTTALAKIAAFQNSPVDKLCHYFSVNEPFKQGALKNGFTIERF